MGLRLRIYLDPTELIMLGLYYEKKQVCPYKEEFCRIQVGGTG